MKKQKPPGYLVLKGEELETELNALGKTVRDFANSLGLEMQDAYGVLSGEKIGVDTSCSFITRYGADFAHEYIDWSFMGMANPYPRIKKRCVKTRHFDRRNAI